MILLGYTPKLLQQKTVNACKPYDVEYVDVSGSEFDYWRAIKARWSGAGDLLIIEQDIVIRPGVVEELLACPESWCAFGFITCDPEYVLYEGLGCTRFRKELMRQVSMQEIQETGNKYWPHRPGPDCCWCHCDAKIKQTLQENGFNVHRHTPRVQHLTGVVSD